MKMKSELWRKMLLLTYGACPMQRGRGRKGSGRAPGRTTGQVSRPRRHDTTTPGAIPSVLVAWTVKATVTFPPRFVCLDIWPSAGRLWGPGIGSGA